MQSANGIAGSMGRVGLFAAKRGGTVSRICRKSTRREPIGTHCAMKPIAFSAAPGGIGVCRGVILLMETNPLDRSRAVARDEA